MAHKKLTIINSIDLYISAKERESMVNACLAYLDSLEGEEKQAVLDDGLGSAMRKMLRGFSEQKEFESYKSTKK